MSSGYMQTEEPRSANEAVRSDKVHFYLPSTKVQEELLHYPHALTLAAASAFVKILKFYIKVFKTLFYLNPQMDLVYIRY